MRVALRLDGRSCVYVAVDERSIVQSGSGEPDDNPDAAIESVLARLQRDFDDRITDFTLDVSPILRRCALAEVLAIRIAPRPPADDFHSVRLPRAVEGVVSRTVHVRGGHDMRGHQLAALGIESFAAELPSLLSGSVRNVAITAVGSTATKAHETRIADAILGEDSRMSVSISHDFHSHVFSDRDFTTILNSALTTTGESLAIGLTETFRRFFPSARLFYAKNDGGSAPLSRLSVVPVHGLYPEPAMRLSGAALLAGIPDGDVVVCTDGGVSVGRTNQGIPVSSPMMRHESGPGIATNSAVIQTFTANHQSRPETESVVVDLRNDTESALPFGLRPTMSPETDVALIGCAVAPVTAWIDRLQLVTKESDLRRVQHVAEEDAQASAVQSGANPALAGIIESNVLGMAYSNPGIVRIRVQAAGTPVDGTDPEPVAAEGAFRKW